MNKKKKSGIYEDSKWGSNLVLRSLGGHSGEVCVESNTGRQGREKIEGHREKSVAQVGVKVARDDERERGQNPGRVWLFTGWILW